MLKTKCAVCGADVNYRIDMTMAGCVDCDTCPHRSDDCLCDISSNDDDCPLLNNN